MMTLKNSLILLLQPLMHMRLAAIMLMAFLSFVIAPAAAIAQEPVSTDLYRERPRNEGNRIVFCLRPLGAIAEFEAELADAIGQVLMTEVRTFTVNPQSFPVRPTGYDYVFGLAYEQIFILMAERCDVIMGTYLSTSAPDWLRVSRPYLSASVLGVSRDADVKHFTDLKPGARVGVQVLTPADNGLTSYIDTLPKDSGPDRVISRNNRALATALLDGSVDAALIWEGALMTAAEGDPAGAGLHIMGKLPFPVPPVHIGASVRAGDDFLGAQIDQAIEALEADGTLAEMASRHKVTIAGAAQNP